ncbi:hypothetical protein Tco_1535091, partial [Tanacetum coccineum]
MLAPTDAGPNYPMFLEVSQLKKSQGFDVNVEGVAKLSLTVNNHLYPEESKEISEAYDLFQTFKRIFVDLSQSYFRHPKSTNAFRVVEIELGGSTLPVLLSRLHKLDVNLNCYVSERCPVSSLVIPASHHIDVGLANPDSPPGL